VTLIAPIDVTIFVECDKSFVDGFDIALESIVKATLSQPKANAQAFDTATLFGVAVLTTPFPDLFDEKLRVLSWCRLMPSAFSLLSTTIWVEMPA
jgi:hypothetical protein